MSDTLKVLVLVPSMRIGGAERFVSLLLQHLDRRQFAPMLAIAFDSEIAYAIPADVPVYWLSAERGVTATLDTSRYPADITETFDSSIRWLDGMACRLGALAQRVQPDIIVSSPLWAGLLATAARDLLPARTRLIHRVDSPASVSTAQTALRPLFQFILKNGFAQAGAVVAVSDAVRRDLLDNFGVPDATVTVLHNPVDMAMIRRLAEEPVAERWFQAGQPPVIIFVGRLERVKGLEYLVRAMPLILGRVDAQCLLVGDGSHRGYLQALARHLDVHTRVQFAGRQSNPFKYVKNSSVFVLPSVSEGMPNVLLEAMACGCPVVASDIAGGVVREILEDGASGVFVPVGDVAALADAIVNVLDRQDLRRSLTAAGDRRVRHFNVPEVIELNQELILRVARDSAVPVSPRHHGAGRASVDGQDARGAMAKAVVPGMSVRLRPLFGRVLAMGRRRLWRRPGLGGGRAARGGTERAVGADGRTGVLVLVSRLDDPSAGSGTRVLLKHLSRAKYRLSLAEIFGSGRPLGVPSDVEHRCLQDWEADGGLPPAPWSRDGLFGRFLTEVAWFDTLAAKLSTLVSAQGAAVVFAQGYFASIVASLAAARAAGQWATVCYLHTEVGQLPGSVAHGELHLALLDHCLPSVNRVAAASLRVYRDLERRGHLQDAQLTQIEDALDIEVSADLDSVGTSDRVIRRLEKIAAVVATGSPGDEALRLAMELVSSEHVDLELAVVPSGPRLPDELAEGVLPSSLPTGRGALAEARDRDLMAADLFVFLGHPSLPGVPGALAAAMIAGKAVVVGGASPSILELLGGGAYGILVPQDDGRAIAEAILQLAWDEEQHAAFARAARERIAGLRPEQSMRRFENLIDGVPGVPLRGD